MKLLLVGLLFTGSAYAACSIDGFVLDGVRTICTTCCDDGNCTTRCRSI